MTCADVRLLLPDLALGDLDAEPAAAVGAHLKDCAACRAEEAALGRTLGTLQAAPVAAPSAERRSAAVAAMARAHAERSEQLLTRRPRSWVPWATAAAFLLAVAGALSVRSPGVAFTVAQVTGQAQLLDRERGEWRPVLGGMPICVGDRVVTPKNGRLRLTVGAAELTLDQETSIEVMVPRRVTLDRGRLLAVAPPSGADSIVITDLSNNAVRVSGRVEISIRDVSHLVGGSLEGKGREPILPDAKTKVERSLTVRVESGEAALDGAREQRLRAGAGEEGLFEYGGKPKTVPMGERRIGSWAEDK